MLTTDLSSHLALITGATGGIGKASCLALAALGCSIAVHYNSAADTAESLVKQLQDKGVKAQAFQADLSSYDATRNLHADVVSSMGEPTILFNNAGSSLGMSGVKSIEEAMEKKGWGRVVFCSSVAGFTGGIVGPHYASSKSALHGLVHWLASAYAKKGITVNGIAPALIAETKMLPGQTDELANKIPIGRCGTPDEIAETLVWMVKTGYVTNKIVAVDGGMFIQ